MLKIFFNKKRSDLDELIFSLEKLTNIAIVKAATNQDEITKSIINGLEKLFLSWLDLKTSNPAKYQDLIDKANFFEEKIKLEIPKKELQTEETESTELGTQTEQKEQYLKFENLNRESNLTSRFLTGFGNIWLSAIKNENDEVSAYVVYHLEYILAELARDRRNEDQIEQILRFLNQLTWEILSKHNGKRIDRSIYPAAISWYINTVFNNLGDNGFDLELLPVFNKFFYSSAKIIIKHTADEVFKYLVSSLVDGAFAFGHDIDKLWEYQSILLRIDHTKYQTLEQQHSIHQTVQSLISSGQKMTDPKQLSEWLKKFNELTKVIKSNIPNEHIRELEKNEKDIKQGVEKSYKHNSLLDLVLAIGAYALFSKKYHYVRMILEYKQPPDSDASWVGENIVPDTIQDALNIYPKLWRLEREYDFWEDHHGSSRYFKTFFIVLLLKLIMKSHQSLEQLSNLTLNFDLDPYQLSTLTRIDEELSGLIAKMQEPDYWSILVNLGIPQNEQTDLVEKIRAVLNRAKAAAEQKLAEVERQQGVSQIKVEKFIKDFQTAFNKRAGVREILKWKSKFIDKSSEEYSGELQRFGINIIDNKAAFFDEWYIHYGDWGSNYGENMAIGENNHLIEEIVSTCTEVKDQSLSDTLSKFKNLSDVILIANVSATYQYLHDKSEFTPAWKKSDLEPLNLGQFKGWYKFRNLNIPVFEWVFDRSEVSIIALDSTKMGDLIQYSPLNSGENLAEKHGIFYINIKEFSKEPELMNKYISSPPDWLKKIGTVAKQEEYLKQRVLLNLLQRFDLTKNPQFQGYVVKIASS
jgi:hypothetical protein